MAVSGDKIRQAREALKLRSKGRQGSQAWVAAQIGAHVTSISDWERGANQPSPRHLAALALALGVTIESLMDGTDDDEESEPMTPTELLDALAPLAYLLDRARAVRA